MKLSPILAQLNQPLADLSHVKRGLTNQIMRTAGYCVGFAVGYACAMYATFKALTK